MNTCPKNVAISTEKCPTPWLVKNNWERIRRQNNQPRAWGGKTARRVVAPGRNLTRYCHVTCNKFTQAANPSRTGRPFQMHQMRGGVRRQAPGAADLYQVQRVTRAAPRRARWLGPYRQDNAKLRSLIATRRARLGFVPFRRSPCLHGVSAWPRPAVLGNAFAGQENRNLR